MKLDSSIALSRNTRDLLKEIGHKGDTYDSLIRKLIDVKKENRHLKLSTGIKRLETNSQNQRGLSTIYDQKR